MMVFTQRSRRYLTLKRSSDTPDRARIVHEYSDAYLIAWEDVPKNTIGIYTPPTQHRTLLIQKSDPRILSADAPEAG